MVDEVGAEWIPSPNCWTGRYGHTPGWIILHGTAGGSSAQAIANWFAQSSAQVSTHYVIGQDGQIVQCVLEKDSAWGNGVISGPPGKSGDGVHHDPWWDSGINPNLLTISIEHVKPHTDNSDNLTTAQKEASFKLVRDICKRHNIPMRYADANGGITGHYSMDPVNRSHCPGPYPWDELWTFLQQSEVTVLQINQTHGFFVETVPNQRWHCTVPSHLDGKEHDIAYGLLEFYRTFGQVGLNGLSIFGLPTSDEIPVPNSKQAVVQFCERGVMLYDPQHEIDRVPGLTGPCCPAHIDQGPGQDPRIAALQAQVAQLQQQLQQCQSSHQSSTQGQAAD
ncbi:MAG TPA: peptidoglycan recognition family protein [Ktedonobacteraceae bacterium]|jgi:N-acetyl-anhydromuramyl-L-alanine amidase AmpD|nr:peptidoglycan recognition family protein [Ktedonobacteraceae bacterium]